MNAILKKDNVFIYAKKLKNEVRNDPSFLMDCLGCEKISLYGGRVKVETTNSSYTTYLYIDGIHIFSPQVPDRNGIPACLLGYLSIETLIAYLNQIEALGVDSFLENYQKSLREFKKDMSEQSEKLEANLTITEDKEYRERLRRIQEILYKLSFIILALSINMFAGYDNHVYEEAYQSIINVYSK